MLKKCLNCGKPFSTNKKRNAYCCRKCFDEYYAKKKSDHKFPIIICPSCGKRTQLDFFPTRERVHIENWVCPHCGKTRDK